MWTVLPSITCSVSKRAVLSSSFFFTFYYFILGLIRYANTAGKKSTEVAVFESRPRLEVACYISMMNK